MWQGHYLVMLECITSVALRIVESVSYVSRINHESHFARRSSTVYFVVQSSDV